MTGVIIQILIIYSIFVFGKSIYYAIKNKTWNKEEKVIKRSGSNDLNSEISIDMNKD